MKKVFQQVRFRSQPLSKIIQALMKLEELKPEATLKAVSDYLTEREADSQVSAMIIECFERIATCDTDAACDELMLLEDKLNTYKSEQEQLVKVKSGMYLKLGLLASAFVAVILI